ncbi:MAG: ATP-dependent helicase HrpB, partial [Deinococcus sp.]
MSLDLPVLELLPRLRETLAERRLALLQAPPGAGKSTGLPPRLLDEPWLEGRKVVLLQPRRVAARGVAARIAAGLGEEVGGTVGYRVRFESRVSARTRLTVMNEGILTRMVQVDPELPGVGLILFDKFHERS